MLRATAALVLGVTTGLALRLVFSDVPAQALAAVEQPVAPADAILVLGGDLRFQRTATAVRLWQAGLAPVVIFSGGGGEGDSGESLARAARTMGLPEPALRIENAARSTRQNMVFSAPLVRGLGVRRLLLVTSSTHLLRATLAARRVMPEVTVIPVAAQDTPPPTGQRLRHILVLEYSKLAYYVLRRYV